EGLVALPQRHRAEALVGGYEVHEMGRARTGEADDDDRRLQLDIVDLRMALQQVVDEQPVGRVANAVVEQDQAAEPGALVVVADLVQPEAEALLEIIGPEFVELRVLTSGGEDGVDTEICLRTLAV